MAAERGSTGGVKVLGEAGTLPGYDLWAKEYDAFANPMIALAEWALDHAPAGFAGARVLELGCGTGRNAARALREGAASYLGLDGSGGMLERARERTQDPRARFAQADLLRAPLPFANGAFDLVLVTLVLEHFERVGGVLPEAARALAPGGRLRILEIHPRLAATGNGAHFWHEGTEHRLPSFGHDADELDRALAATPLRRSRVTEWSPSETLMKRLEKLRKHAGKAMLLDYEATSG